MKKAAFSRNDAEGHDDHSRDDANWLEEVTRGGVALGEYEYDAQGQRLTKSAGGDTIRYHYDGIDLLYTNDATGTLEVFIKDISGNALLGIQGDETYAYRQDMRGSITNILDSAGDVVKSYAYDAYGNTSGAAH